jgi:hypothetical protein
MKQESDLAFSVSDIVVLMETCRKHGVTEFTAGGLSLKLVNDLFIRDTLQEHETSSRKTRQDTDQLLIEDPLAFEEALLRAQSE